ncbi:MAG: type II toxin-antitoxin system VapC family toxin [Cyanobium sp.]
MRRILIDSGILVCYYLQHEPLHPKVVAFFDHTAVQLITSPICIAEVLWLLGDPGDSRVLAAQNHLLKAVGCGAIEAINLLAEDYIRVAELSQRDADLPGDFADLTLVALSERLGIAEILTLDGDFDVYRRFRREPFQRVSLG